MPNYLNESRKLAFQYNEAVAEQIRNICSPVFDNFGIKDFVYTRYFPDGHSVLHLSTNMNWNNFFSRRLMLMELFLKKQLIVHQMKVFFIFYGLLLE